MPLALKCVSHKTLSLTHTHILSTWRVCMAGVDEKKVFPKHMHIACFLN